MRYSIQLRAEARELKQRRETLRAEAKKIADALTARGTDRLTTDEDARFTELVSEADTLRAEIDAKESRADELDEIAAERAAAPAWAGSTWSQSEPVWTGQDVRNLTDDAAVSLAKRALDATNDRNAGVPESGLLKVTDMLEGREAGRAARWAVAVSDPAYERAFAKVLRDPQRGHLNWSETERAAYSRVNDLARSMTLTDANGGYLVPFTLDPAVMLSSAGSVNPMRRLARNVTTTTESWNGVTSAGVTAAWYAEEAEVTDDSPTIGAAPIPVHRGSAYVPYTFEVGDDADLLSQLSRLLLDAADQLNATAYTTGSGSDEPTGFVTALDGSSSEVAPTTGETFAAADVYKVLEAVPPRFRGNAAWVANLSIINRIDQFETSNGARLFPSLDNNVLLRRPIFENSVMDGTINPAVTADNFVLAAGDWQAGMVIVDRIGASLELIPNLMGANGRPTGERGAFLWWRTGSDVVVPNALRLLNVATAE
jgi:HK97 family phage major capsid protein